MQQEAIIVLVALKVLMVSIAIVIYSDKRGAKQ